MYRHLVFALLLAGFNSVSLADSETTVFTSAESFSGSDGAPLKSYLNKLRGPKPDNGTYVLSRNKIDFGMAWDGWELSAFHRNDYNLSFHEDTLDFAFRNNNKEWNIPLDKEYQVEVVANQYQLTGLKLAHEFDFSNGVGLYIAASYLHGTEVVSGYLGKAEDGSGGVVSKTRVQLPFSDRYIVDLEGNLHTDYYFTDDPLFRRQVDEPTGQGYSIDLGVSWQVSKNLLLNLRIDDALGEIHWHNLAHTTADATSDRLVEDENGVWQANPSFEGWALEESFTQDLTLRSRFNIHYDFNKYYFGYEFDDMGIAEFHRTHIGFHVSDRWAVESGIDISSGAVAFTLYAPLGDFHILLDSTAAEEIHNLGFAWSIHFPIQ